MTESEVNPTGVGAEPIPATMQAITRDRWGGPDVMTLSEVPVPALEADRVLIKVKAGSLNVYDWHMATGTPYMVRALYGLRTPKYPIPGADVAGTVMAVGDDVTGFEVGDEVFGESGAGAFAQYAAVRERQIVHLPDSVSAHDGAATGMAGLTALQGLRDVGQLQAGERVLINGASGGVGTFAVQIAKALGAEVTAVCSTGKVDMVSSIGADKVIDYKKTDFTQTETGYDLVFDNVGYRPWSETSRVLKAGGRLVTITGPKHNMMGPMRENIFRKVLSMLGGKSFTWFTAAVKTDDLQTLSDYLVSGAVKPVIEQVYDLADMPQALAYLGEGHAHGKLVVEVS